MKQWSSQCAIRLSQLYWNGRTSYLEKMDRDRAEGINSPRQISSMGRVSYVTVTLRGAMNQTDVKEIVSLES